MLPATFRCPRCKCHALYLARRRGLDWLMTVFGLRPARCMTCSKRFYLRHSRVKQFNLGPPKDTFVRGGGGVSGKPA
jgi:DNA-directed RNA polymerase subunit RPC12/RpoP